MTKIRFKIPTFEKAITFEKTVETEINYFLN